MNTTFFRRSKPPPKALALHLIVVSLRPLLVNAQFRAYPSYTTPSWYIGLTFLLTALLIFGVIFLFYLRQRCLGRQRGRNHPVSPGSTIFATSHRGGPTGGLDPAAVKAFPVLTFREAARAGVNTCTIGLDCAVCLSAFEEDETLRLMPKCGHAFHPGCVDVWLASHTTCPCCRADLLSLPEDDDSPSASSSSTLAIKASNNVVVDVRSPPAAGSEPSGAVIGG